MLLPSMPSTILEEYHSSHSVMVVEDTDEFMEIESKEKKFTQGDLSSLAVGSFFRVRI